MKKISSILFLATLLSFVACKETAKTEAAAAEVATEVAAGTEAAAGAVVDQTAQTVAQTVPTTADATTTATTATPADGAVAPAKPTGPITKIEFVESTFDFGTVKESLLSSVTQKEVADVLYLIGRENQSLQVKQEKSKLNLIQRIKVQKKEVHKLKK
jgi:hypothetical protein